MAFELYLKYLLYLISAQFCYFITGYLLLKLFRIRQNILSFTHIFTSLFCGVLFYNIIFSSYFTLFKTSQFLFTIPLILFYIEYKKSKLKFTETKLNSASYNLEFKNIALLLLSSIIIYTIFFINTIQFNGFPFLPANEDYLLYNNISYYSMASGEENVFNVLNTINPIYHGPKPHHFFETWVNVFIAEVFNGKYVLHFFLNTYPFLTLVLMTGLLAYTEKHKVSKLYSFTWIHLFLLIGGCGSVYLKNINALSGIEIFNFYLLNFNLLKIINCSIFFIAFILLNRNNYRMHSYIVLASMPLVSITVSFAIIGGFAFFAFFNFIHKQLSKNEVVRLVIYILFISFFVVLFYYTFDHHSLNMKGTSVKMHFSDDLNKLLLSINLKACLNIAAVAALSYLSLFLFYIIIYLFILKYYGSQVLPTIISKNMFLIFGMLLSSLAGWALLNTTTNSVQLFTVPANMIMNLLLFIVSISIIFNPKIHIVFKQLFILFTFYSIIVNFHTIYTSIYSKTQFPVYSSKYILKIQEYFQYKNKNPIGVALKSSDEYDNTFDFYNAFYPQIYYLPYFKNGATTISISDFDTSPSSTDLLANEQRMEAVKLGGFYNFVINQKNISNFTSIAESQIDFIKKHKIEYLIADKKAMLNGSIKNITRETITDSLSGETFLIFDLKN